MDKKNISFTLGARLKELRQEHGLSHDKLRDQLKNRYGISVSRDSLMAYEVADETRSKADKLPNLGMRVEYLYCLADFFEVSTDYLLGNTEIKTLDMEEKGVFEYMGLSQKAGEMILAIKNAPVTAGNPVIRRLGWLLNEIIANPSFFFMLRDLSRTLGYYSGIHENLSDENADGLWYEVGEADISERDILNTLIKKADERYHFLVEEILGKVNTGEFDEVVKIFPFVEKKPQKE